MLSVRNVYSSRRTILWEKLRGFWPISSLAVSTALGAGLFPVAPGTAGTLAAMPLAYWVSDWFWPWKVFFWGVLTLVGTLAAGYFDELMGTSDNQNIVIDEVIGLGITSWTAGQDWKTWIAAFLLFRFFDVLKFPPVRQIDQWSKKKSSRFWGGFGVIADDMAAGFQALAMILILQAFKIL